MNIQFLQLNLNGNWAAQQLLGQVAAQRGADLLLLSEPFVRGGSDRWCYSLDRKASLGISPGSGLIHDENGSGQGFAWMRFGDLSVFSCYWRPGSTLQEYAYFLGDLEDAIRARGDSKLVIGGDFNAWNVEWGSRTNNPRGDLLADFAASLGLSLCNTGNAPTFVRGDATSVIDVTFSRGVEISGWEVLDELSLSDHLYVAYGIKPAPPAQPVEAPVDAIHPGWSLRSLNLEAFQGYVRNTPLNTGRGIASGNHANASAERLDNYIASACDVAMSLRTQGPPGKRPMYWWSDAIDDLRQKALRLRRAYQASLRRIGHPGSQAVRAEFTAARRALRTEIRRSKEQAWKDLCRQVDSDPWGRPYKLVMRKFGDGTARLASKGREDAISDHLFPAAPITDWDSMPSPEIRNLFDAFNPESDELVFTREIPRFSADELFKAARRLSSGKASGPSGIPNEILRRIVQARPRSILKVYNDCLESLTFPTRWKSAKLVLLHKGAGKPVASPSSFRPICLLDTPGKLFERLILQRLEAHLDKNGSARRAPNQFGFRRGISTETAISVVTGLATSAAQGTGRYKPLCVLVTLDVQNAFNSLRWPVIDEALRKKATPDYLVRMIRSWLSDRELLVGENRTPRPVTCGVPQGSVLGPTLWNVAYDDLLAMDVPPGAHLVGFADDLAVVGTARTGEQLQEIVNRTLRMVDEWMASHGLQLAHHKTEAVMLTRRRAYNPPQLIIGGHQIELSPHLRYLGVILDSKLSFGKHVETVASKAATSAAALSRLMPNLSGPGQWKRRLLSSVVESQLLYAAPVWGEIVNRSTKATTNLRRPQRTAALRVIRAYRTVSDDAAFLLAGMPPVDLLAMERGRIKARAAKPPVEGVRPTSKAAIRSAERKSTIRDWSWKWLRSNKAPWTHLVIPNLDRWVNRTTPRVPLTYHMTQALTGHGCFQSYLYRMGRTPSPRCVHCPCESDTAEHTLLHCPYWDGARVSLRERLGRSPTVVDVPGILCGPQREDLPADHVERANALQEAEETFRQFYKMVEEILTLKEVEERARQAAEAAVLQD